MFLCGLSQWLTFARENWQRNSMSLNRFRFRQNAAEYYTLTQFGDKKLVKTIFELQKATITMIILLTSTSFVTFEDIKKLSVANLSYKIE